MDSPGPNPSAAFRIFFVLSVIGSFLVLIAMVTLVVAWRSANRLQNIRKTWPTTDAVVLECKQVEGRIIRARTPWATECRFRYEVAGKTYISTNRTSFEIPANPDARNWIGRHPPGSHMTIYYSPEDPGGHISLGGADANIDPANPGRFLRNASLLALVGVVMFGLAFIIRGDRQRMA